MNKCIGIFLFAFSSLSFSLGDPPDDDTTTDAGGTKVCSSSDQNKDKCGAWGLEWRLVQGSYAFDASTENAVYAFNSLDDVRDCLSGGLADSHKMISVCDKDDPRVLDFASAQLSCILKTDTALVRPVYK